MTKTLPFRVRFVVGEKRRYLVRDGIVEGKKKHYLLRDGIAMAKTVSVTRSLKVKKILPFP